jgi:hypothetical protein
MADQNESSPAMTQRPSSSLDIAIRLSLMASAAVALMAATDTLAAYQGAPAALHATR